MTDPRPYISEEPAVLDMAYSRMPDTLAIQLADGPTGERPPQSEAAHRKAERRRKKFAAEMANRDAQYREALLKYEQAVSQAGSEHDPRMPTPDLALITPCSSNVEATQTCLDKATAHEWDGHVSSVRVYRGGLPSLGKRN